MQGEEENEYDNEEEESEEDQSLAAVSRASGLSVQQILRYLFNRG